ncbi:gustatory receptor 68a-like isoform X2 [Daktulosphaira vitifoliae]|nr:gustatory receptor 68a-like isoform X2 [Daktulosphaira vitifoliae]
MEWVVTCASIVQAIVSVMIACLYRFNETSSVLNQMFHLHSQRPSISNIQDHKSTMLYFGIVTGLIFIRIFAVVLSRPDNFMFKETVLCLPALLIPVMVECDIVQVCVVFDDTCRQIVQDLNTLCNCRHLAKSRQLKILWEKHWQCCQLINTASKCYGLDLLLNMIASMLSFIFYTYITLKSAYALTLDDPYKLFWTIGLICQLVNVSFRIVFVSYQADKIKHVAENLVKISLREVLKSCSDDDTSSIIVINLFTNQVIKRDIKISACGFFSINMSLIHGLIQLATTYLIVIIQYSSKSKTKP